MGKEKTTRTPFTPFFNFDGGDFKGFESATQTWKDLVTQQVRSSWAMAEQGMAIGRKAADFWATQTAETLKYQQEAMKFSWGMADDVRKAAMETAEKSWKA